MQFRRLRDTDDGSATCRSPFWGKPHLRPWAWMPRQWAHQNG